MKVVLDHPFGVYVWQLPDDRIVADENGNYLSINSKYGDPRRIAELEDAAKLCGINEGHPLFLPGQRKIDDEEYEKQQERMKSGLIPDEYDIGAYLDEERNRD